VIIAKTKGSRAKALKRELQSGTPSLGTPPPDIEQPAEAAVRRLEQKRLEREHPCDCGDAA